MYRALIIAASVATVSALCPGADGPCSGHGTCGEFDKCTCYRNWQGDDCSARTCPFATSWNTVVGIASTESAGEAVFEHGYAECSSKGECDRKTGMCKCFDGFSGVACRRMVCDEGCNEHGTCELVSKGNGYDGWDATKIQKCVCDAGWAGVKCDQKKCKRGDDPITRADFDADTTTWTAQTAETQTITIDPATAGTAGTGMYTLSYTDWRGETWTTWPLSVATGTAIEIEEALEALPNEAIPHVTVVATTPFTGTGDAVFTVTFDSSLNSGDQNSLVVDVAGCTDYGCQPKFEGVDDATVVVTTSVVGTTEWVVCSNRGTCNAEAGDCECFDGFTGEACEIQTIIT